MDERQMRMTDSPDRRDIERVAEAMIALNEARSGVSARAVPLSIFLSDPGSGEVSGGLVGETRFGVLYVDLLFIPEPLRGQ
jgi:hypothetical protein